MKLWALRILKWLAAATLLVVLASWLVFESRLFRDWRINLISEVLTEELGQPLLIEGDVRIILGTTIYVHVSGARLPSTEIDNFDLATLELLEWELNLRALMDRKLEIDNLLAKGLDVRMVSTSDGTTSWRPGQSVTDAAEKKTAQPEEILREIGQSSDPSVLSFLSQRTITFSEISFFVANEASGFEFDFQLDSIFLKQLEGGELVTVDGSGSVNGESFELSGRYPQGRPFTNKVSIGALVLSFDGEQLPQQPGFSAKLRLDTGEIGNLLDVLRLERSFEGSGTFAMDVTSTPNLLSFQDVDSSLNLGNGGEISVTGNIDDLSTLAGFNIAVSARLHPKGRPPATAQKLEDFKITEISARIIGENDKLAFEELLFHTNAFDRELKRVGPISIGRIYRTSAQTLGLGNVKIQTGKPEAPFLKAQGDIDDILTLSGVHLTGDLNGSASLLINDLPKETVARLGGVKAQFELVDQDGGLSLKRLSAHSTDTDLWNLTTEIKVADVEKLEGLEIDVGLNIPKTRTLLDFLKMKPASIQSLSTEIHAASGQQSAGIEMIVRADSSDITANVELDLSQKIRKVRGSLSSKKMRLSEIQDAIDIIAEIDARMEDYGQAEPEEGPPIQPLVLNEDHGRPPIQPLVLEDAETDVFDIQRLIKESDILIDVKAPQLVGAEGTMSIDTQLKADGGQLQAGPLSFTYGPGKFSVTANIDLNSAPDRVHIKGSTSGWELAALLKEAGVKLPAQGVVAATVDVTGSIAKNTDFLNSLRGSAVLSLRNGAIATSLLELAGLGIFEWLVSPELAQGYTEIVCVRAPIALDAGKIAFDPAVIETKSVQLVAVGALDWARDTIQIRAEPRPVRKPLARSAWPFDVTGKLSEPKFKLQVGGSTSRRADGASSMPDERKPCWPDILQLEN